MQLILSIILLSALGVLVIGGALHGCAKPMPELKEHETEEEEHSLAA